MYVTVAAMQILACLLPRPWASNSLSPHISSACQTSSARDVRPALCYPRDQGVLVLGIHYSTI